VQYLSGHSTPAMVRRYSATYDAEKAARAHERFSPHVIRRWMEQGRLSVVRLPNGHLRISRRDIENVLRAGLVRRGRSAASVQETAR
jgi:hypothetical protein